MLNKRILALLKKEVLQIKRDKSALLIAFLLPLVLTFIFGYAISIDTNKIDVAIVSEAEQTSDTSELIGFFEGSRFVNLKKVVQARREVEELLLAKKVNVIVIIPVDFNRRLAAGGLAEVSMITDGSDPNTAIFSYNYVVAIMRAYAAYLGVKKGLNARPIFEVQTRYWFNESLKANHLLNIGSIGFVLSISGTLLTALVVARDWERGTMEYLIATGVSIYEIVFAKAFPYLVLGIGSFFISFGCVIIFFGVPFRGSMLIFGLIGVLYLLLTTSLGLFISTVSKSQFVAAQGAILASMVPTIMLSGLVYEVETMPRIMQCITYIVPAKYLVAAMKTIFLMGNEWSILLPNILGIVVLSTILLFFTLRKTTKFID